VHVTRWTASSLGQYLTSRSAGQLQSRLQNCQTTGTLGGPLPDTIPQRHMSKSFAAPSRIRRIAARRVFKAPGGKPVVVTLGVPQAVFRPVICRGQPQSEPGIGFFEDFKSADTLLIDVDHDGLHAFIAWLRDAIELGHRKTISDCPGSVVQAGLHIELLRSRDDIGILRTAEGAFAWQRSEDGWADIVELLSAMKSGAGHQYLDGPRDEIQAMASIGEYGIEWWNSLEAR
jgi:hypothetical protein